MANPTDNSLTPTGTPSFSNTAGMNQQFIVWSPPEPGIKPMNLTAWQAYLAAIPASGQNIA